jgi:hypothetical protein
MVQICCDSRKPMPSKQMPTAAAAAAAAVSSCNVEQAGQEVQPGVVDGADLVRQQEAYAQQADACF